MTEITINRTCAILDRCEQFTSGMVGARIKFSFSSEWVGLSKTAVFTNGDTTIDVLNVADEITIPHEVLAISGKKLKVGVYGYTVGDNGNIEIAIPTVYADLGKVVKGADPSGDESTEPSLPVWAQIQSDVSDLGTRVTELEQHGGGGEGTSDHTQLTNRDAANQHPITAITGLQTALDGKQPSGDYATSGELDALADIVDGKADAADIPSLVGYATEAYVDTVTSQVTPLFAATVADCTDTTKVYVLPDGYIYAYLTKSVTHTPTNQVPNSKAADGTPFNGGQGYKDNTRLSLSSGESVQNGYTVTGFIPVAVGDTIRFKNVNTSSSSANVFVIFYDSAHNYVGYLRDARATEVLSAGICVLDDALTLNSGTLDGTAFFRVSMLTNDQADYFFTINELTEPTIVTEEGWFSTDHAFVPADYEDRIIELEARVDDIADDTNNAPTYVANEAKRVADVVKGKQTVSSLTFSAMSDMHIRTNDSYWADNVTSCRDAGIGLAELQKHLRLDFSALLGDYTVGGASDTVEKVKQDISIVKTFMSKGQKGIPNLWLTGNHDINYGASSDRRMTEDEMFAYITNNNNGTVQDFDNIGRNYGYIDFNNQKIRCIYLNTVDSLDYPDNVGSADDNSEVTAIQTQWIADVGLNLTAKSDAAEWGIVLFSHHCLSIFPHATTIITAYRNGESGSVNVTTDGVTTAVDYDFNTSNRGEIICAIHGHDHNFSARKISNERWDLITPANAWLWSICIPNIDTKRNNEKATDTDAAYREAFGEFDEGGNPVYYPKTQGTATSTSFCVVTIDRRNRKIHAVAYGAGHDRTFDF